jgi:hypothetical protein
MTEKTEQQLCQPLYELVKQLYSYLYKPNKKNVTWKT